MRRLQLVQPHHNVHACFTSPCNRGASMTITAEIPELILEIADVLVDLAVVDDVAVHSDNVV